MFSSLKAKHYHVINFPVPFLGYEIPILIIIVVQTLCNDIWSRCNVCDCYFMMTGIQSFLRDTWHSYATVMRVFIMCMMWGWDERKLCLVSLCVPIPQRECHYLGDIQKTNNRHCSVWRIGSPYVISALILCKCNRSCVFCIL